MHTDRLPENADVALTPPPEPLDLVVIYYRTEASRSSPYEERRLVIQDNAATYHTKSLARVIHEQKQKNALREEVWVSKEETTVLDPAATVTVFRALLAAVENGERTTTRSGSTLNIRVDTVIRTGRGDAGLDD